MTCRFANTEGRSALADPAFPGPVHRRDVNNWIKLGCYGSGGPVVR